MSGFFGFFRLRERGSSIGTELFGGLTTFVTMAYIIVVNPAILAFAGLPPGPATVATILAAAFGSILMGIVANRPIAVAPYMGENAFLAFGLAALGITWQERLGVVFVSGAAFLVLTVLKLRSWFLKSISPSLKHSFAVGIGLFLAFIGLYKTGIVASFVRGMPAAALLEKGSELLRNPDVPVKIGDLHDARVLLALLGFTLMVVLLVRRVRGAILIGIVTVAVLGYVLGLGAAPNAIAALPFTGDHTLAPIALQLDIGGAFRLALLPVLLTLFLMSLLDTLGTLAGVGAAGGFLDEKGDFPDVDRPMFVDALSCMFSALVGTSTSGAYIESATGIRDGARTGLAAIATGLLFLLMLFFLPLVEPLQKLDYAYGPALIAVGVLMLDSARRIDFIDLTELVPAFVTIVLMIFTFNIGNGLAAGLVLHPLLKLGTGRFREVNAGSLVLAALCATYFVFGLPH